MAYILLRAVYGIWFVGVIALVIWALADLVFGGGSFAERARNFLPRVAVAVVWPLAALTPRGRYLLWTKWRNR